MFIVWPSCRKKVQDKIFYRTASVHQQAAYYRRRLQKACCTSLLPGEEDMLGGIIAIRKMNVRVVEETGLTGAEEILYPEVFRYLSDLLSYAAVGARSSEDPGCTA